MAKTLITLCGPSEWASFNSMWASMKNFSYIPDKIIIAAFHNDIERAKRTAARMQKMLEVHGIKLEPTISEVKDSSMADVVAFFSNLYKSEMTAENEISIDVTNGRKMMVLCALKSMEVRKLKHMFYLYIDTLNDCDYSYMCIPLNRQRLYDFLESDSNVK